MNFSGKLKNYESNSSASTAKNLINNFTSKSSLGKAGENEKFSNKKKKNLMLNSTNSK